MTRARIITTALLLLLLTCCDQSGMKSKLVLPQPLVELKRSISIKASQTPTATLTITASPTPPPTFTSTPEPSSTPTITPTPSATATATPEPTITPSTGALSVPRLDLNPDQPLPYLETFRLLTYYGSPTGRGLGILGESAREYMTRDLRNLALELQALSPDRFVLPTYHMVTTVADRIPGKDENYSHHVKDEMIQEWIDAARENQVAVIIDLQPARADLQEEFDRIKHFLREPHVHLALDPEFFVNDSQIPGVHLGLIEPEQVNLIQAQLNEIALEVGVNRVLIIHQFVDSMVPDKDLWDHYPHVELVIDADGVGGRYSKLHDYEQYVLEPGFEYAGIKVFTRHDTGALLTIPELTELEPPPAIIIFQ